MSLTQKLTFFLDFALFRRSILSTAPSELTASCQSNVTEACWSNLRPKRHRQNRWSGCKEPGLERKQAVLCIVFFLLTLELTPKGYKYAACVFFKEKPANSRISPVSVFIGDPLTYWITTDHLVIASWATVEICFCLSVLCISKTHYMGWYARTG